MTIKIERKGNKFIVETDHKDSVADHPHIQSDRSLKAAMKVFGIDKIEARNSYQVHDAFDREFKKKYGRKTGYFSVW